MATFEVVVAGSNNDNRFAVVDYSTPASPTVKLVTAPFSGGCMVDASGSQAAVANFNGSEVVLYDISSPASPVQLSTAATGLSGIGAISFDGAHIMVGELLSTRVALIDPATMTVLSKANTTLSGITSVGISGTKGVAAGPNNLAFAVVDYTNPTSTTPPVHVFNSGTGGVFFSGSMAADLDNGMAAVADQASGTVHFFDVSSGTASHLGQETTTQAGVESLSISGSTEAAASTNNVPVTLVSFATPTAPTEKDNATSFAGGATVKIAGNRMAAGDVLSTDVALFTVAGTTATPRGVKASTGLASIATVGFTSFTVASPHATIAASTSVLAFGTVKVNTASTLPVTLSNTGTASLTISGLHATASQYVPTPSGSLTIATGGNKVINVKFTPTAATPFPASLTMTTNDPANPTFSVSLTGAGGQPALTPPGPLNLGSVAVCLTHVANVPLVNTGPVPLSVTSIATSGAPFTEGAGTSLTVPANSTGNIAVTFAPTATGAASGLLTFHTDDPAHPTASVALSGTGTPEPPPKISVNPTSINFGATPLQYFIGIAVTVANTGPCENLNATLTVSGAAFVLTTGNPTMLPTTNSPITTSVAASTSQSFTVVFAPTAVGAAAGTLTITSDDPINPTVTVALTGTGVTVSPAAVELVLDRSGSMATAAGSGTRMQALQSAVEMFSDLVIPSTGFAMGSVQFDDAFAVLTPLANFDATQQAAITAGAQSLSPRNLTSIGGGLQLGQTQLTASTLPRKVAIVFTDGWENTPPMISSVEPAVIAAGTEVYAVGLGDPALLSVAALSALAHDSGGKFFQTTDALVLRKQFVEVLADAFRQNLAVDPIITLTQGQPVQFPVDITNCEGRLGFVLLWEDLNAQIQLSIRAPDGTTFTPSAPAHNRLVRYVQRPGYRLYQIALPPGPGGTIGPKQLGQWVMQIDPVSIAGGSTRASTNVMVESALQMTATVSAPSVTDPILLRVALTDHGHAVSGAKVRVNLTSPAQSLAQISTPQVHARALAADVHLIPPKAQILTKTKVTKHEAKFNEREYLLQMPAPKVDGVYHAEVNATGQACGGVFQRYWSSSFYVGLRRKPTGR
jgi:hypothetical protein